MTKIKLTQEQAKRIEHFKNCNSRVTAIETHLMMSWNGPKNLCLNELSNTHFINSLYVDDYYEIEPEYKEGDWVAHLNGSNIYAKGNTKVVEVHSLEKCCEGFDYVRHGVNGEWGTPVNLLRHATPEEIKSEQERQKWSEIEEGDVLIHKVYGLVGIFVNLHEGYAGIKGIAGADTWNASNCELYAKKVNKDV